MNRLFQHRQLVEPCDTIHPVLKLFLSFGQKSIFTTNSVQQKSGGRGQSMLASNNPMPSALLPPTVLELIRYPPHRRQFRLWDSDRGGGSRRAWELQLVRPVIITGSVTLTGWAIRTLPGRSWPAARPMPISSGARPMLYIAVPRSNNKQTICRSDTLGGESRRALLRSSCRGILEDWANA